MGFSAKWCMGLLPALIASFAVMTSFLANFWCETIQFVPNSSNPDEPVLQFGPWYNKETVMESTNVAGETKYFVRDVCVSFPSGTYIDPKLKTVRSFSIIVTLLGGLTTFFLWMAPCFPGRAQSRWKCMSIFYVVFLTLFQGLTFLILSSTLCTENSIFFVLNPNSLGLIYTDDCQWAGGSTCNVASTVLWFATGIVMLAMGAPQPLPREPIETQEVTYQKTTNPDGTATVAQVAVVKGTAVPKTNNNTMEEPQESA